MNLLDYPKELKFIDTKARMIYNGLSSTSRAHVELQDLIQAGYIGLWDATKRYSSKYSANFNTYATIRIYGEMIDTIRKFSPLSKRANNFTTYFNFVEFDEEYIESCEIDVDSIDRDKIINLLRISVTNPREKRILDRYLKDVNQKDIGIAEGITESRVSQLLKKIIKPLQAVHHEDL